MPNVLYSTNVFLKLMIQRQYMGDAHYVWCSECFDTSKLPAYTLNHNTPPSSDPIGIYRRLSEDVRRRDGHSTKIAEQRLSLTTRALEWHKSGRIGDQEKDDILFHIDKADFSDWRPLVYVIPFEPVRGRVRTVPAAKRAGLGMEYIIEDLKGPEFDIIEF